MIPIMASESTRRRYVANIVSVWQSASPDQLARGRAWYRTAHQVADMMTDGDVRKGAGVIAALSPQTSWWLNIELAADAVETGRPTRHFRDALSKASKILAGVDPEDVLPMRRKTGQFFLCIADPEHPSAVCVDRHAHDIAIGRPLGQQGRGLTAHGRYELVADCYRRAAARLGERPSTVQAVTWVVWRERLDRDAARRDQEV